MRSVTLMGTLHGGVSQDAFFLGGLIGFATGLLLAILLLVLTLRAARLPGTPLANIGFAVCALLWTLGGLVFFAMQAACVDPGNPHLLLVQAAHFAGAAASPIPILAIWRQFASTPRQKTAATVVWILACVCAAAIVVMLCLPETAHPVTQVTGYYAGFFLLVGAAVSLRRSRTPRSAYLQIGRA